jgi:hypothetical protein
MKFEQLILETAGLCGQGIFIPLHRNPRSFRQTFDGFQKADVLVLLNELENIAPGMTAKTMKCLPGR